MRVVAQCAFIVGGLLVLFLGLVFSVGFNVIGLLFAIPYLLVLLVLWYLCFTLPRERDAARIREIAAVTPSVDEAAESFRRTGPFGLH